MRRKKEGGEKKERGWWWVAMRFYKILKIFIKILNHKNTPKYIFKKYTIKNFFYIHCRNKIFQKHFNPSKV